MKAANPKSPVRWPALAAFLCAAAFSSTAPGSTLGADVQVERYREALSGQLPSEARAALEQVDGLARQLLALRSYLRAGEGLPQRWSWSAEEIEAFRATRSHSALLADVARVKHRFETENPGYTLYANTQVRSLDDQLNKWNANVSVGRLADAIRRAVSVELIAAEYPVHPDAASVARLADFLHQWRPPVAAPLAAPGLSSHGRLRAIDFQIMKDGRIIAPTQVSAAQPIWEKQGWSAKLKRATAQTRFVGPLQSPHEPWHYEYVEPESDLRAAER